VTLEAGLRQSEGMKVTYIVLSQTLCAKVCHALLLATEGANAATDSVLASPGPTEVTVKALRGFFSPLSDLL